MKTIEPTTKTNRRFWAGQNWRLTLPVAVVVLWAVAAIFIPMFLPFSATQSDLVQRLQGPSARHWLGTDDFGRDILTRVLVGGRISLEVGVTVTIVSASIGTLVGVIAGYMGVWRAILMRINDGIMAFPAVLLAIGVIAVIGAGQWQTAAVLAVVYIPLFVRVAYAETLSLSRRRFVEAAVVIGVRRSRMMFKHLLPNIVGVIIVQATYVFATSILLESSLSFLGAGVQEPTPSLGGMISDGYPLIDIAWWMVVFPGVALAILVLALSLAGDALSDKFGRRAGAAGGV